MDLDWIWIWTWAWQYLIDAIPSMQLDCADSDIYWQNSGQETVAWFNHLCIHTIHTLYILFIYFIYLPDHSINVITTMLSLWIGSYLSEIYLNLRDKSLTTAGRLLLCNHVWWLLMLALYKNCLFGILSLNWILNSSRLLEWQRSLTFDFDIKQAPTGHGSDFFKDCALNALC